MSKSYETAPGARTGMPPGVPYIVANETAERFSFYGMKAILMVFMTKYLMDSNGPANMSPEEAKTWYHLFSSGVYFTPIFGAILADWLLGKYLTIISVSFIYCFGHLALALDDTRLGLAVGLTLIAIGSGGIKPCVSAHVGDQFGKSNQTLLGKVFGLFYLAINFGAFLSTLLTPYLLEHYGPSWAFGVPGALMLVATWAFWLGRNKFIHIPAGGKAFIKETLTLKSMAGISQLFIIYAFVAMFWALYDQTGSAWVLQAQKMDRHFLGIDWLESQVGAINPLIILTITPLFTYFFYGWAGKVVNVTSLRKIGLGFFLAVISFLFSAYIETLIASGLKPNIIWQLLNYVIITVAEILVSITCLEFSYTQAPPKMKSLVMGFFLMSVSLGNLFTSLVNKLIQNPDGTSKLTEVQYYEFFAATMFITALIFIPVAMWYKEKHYMQDETPPTKGGGKAPLATGFPRPLNA